MYYAAWDVTCITLPGMCRVLCCLGCDVYYAAWDVTQLGHIAYVPGQVSHCRTSPIKKRYVLQPVAGSTGYIR